VSTKAKISSSLSRQQCKPCTAATPRLNREQINSMLAQLDGWVQLGDVISKTFDFNNYHQAISFVNAVAWVSNQEDHHPELTISYNKCKVEYSTHAIHGLSENDFICAAKVDALLQV
jgi:4a-hydroxytetrahydrobiopterin dehydratase